MTDDERENVQEELDPHLREREIEPADELGIVREDAGPENAGHPRRLTRTPGDDDPGSPAIRPDDDDGDDTD